MFEHLVGRVLRAPDGDAWRRRGHVQIGTRLLQLLVDIGMGTSEAGFVMLGNITLTDERRPLYQAEGLFKRAAECVTRVSIH